MPSLKKSKTLREIFSEMPLDIHKPVDEIDEEPEVEAPLPVMPLINKLKPVVVMQPAQPPCALEDATRNSKIVVVSEFDVKVAKMMTPKGFYDMEPDDLAHKLPRGARIRKVAENEFVADQIGGSKGTHTFPTAREAILGFVPHFHG